MNLNESVPMSFKSLLDTWKGNLRPVLSEERYAIRLPADDAARVGALCGLFPGVTPEQVITDLLGAALDEVEAAMPYVPGDKIIREDEFGDPIFEDVGMTPRFLELVREHRKQLDVD